MAFPKAIQNTHSEAYTKLIEEKLLHSAEKKAYYKIRAAYMNSSDPMERLRFYESQKRHSESCKRMQAAQEEYKRAIALKVLKEKGYDVSTATLARLAEIEIPTSMKELMKQVQQNNEKTITMTDPEARELMKQLDTPEHLSLKEQFLQELESVDDESLLEDAVINSPLTMDEKEIK